MIIRIKEDATSSDDPWDPKHDVSNSKLKDAVSPEKKDTAFLCWSETFIRAKKRRRPSVWEGPSPIEKLFGKAHYMDGPRHSFHFWTERFWH